MRMEAGGVELRSRIENAQRADFQSRTKRRKITNSGISVRGLYAEFLEDSEKVGLTHVECQLT